jgi:putative ABC transport system permease protein
LFEIHTMNEMTAQSLMPRLAAMLLALAFGGVAMFLAAIGIYGVLAYVVAQRVREIGIRIALGSSAAAIFKMVLQEGLIIVAVGLAIGLAGAFTLRHAIESQIFGVRAFDPLVVGAAFAAIGAIAFLACALPARRATRVDPVIILNQ